ncbi:MAG: CcmD family protein [Bacteroidetes bacterium]|nr:CcmD family protein [Bacteroidota bacterium]
MRSKKPLLILAFALSSLLGKAQDVTWDETFRQNGKINVVVGVMAIIFIGIIGYLVLQDRKISRLEKQMKSKK